MAALATLADLEAELGRALTPGEEAKADAALASASDYVRAETGRRFDSGTFTVARYVRDGKVTLDSPATVTSIVYVDALGGTSDATGYTLRGNVVYGLGYSGRVEVTYTSTGNVPEELVRVVAAMAARDLTEDRPQGATSYTTTKGPFSESATFDEPTDSAEPTRAEKRIIARYAARRVRSLSVI